MAVPGFLSCRCDVPWKPPTGPSGGAQVTRRVLFGASGPRTATLSSFPPVHNQDGYWAREQDSGPDDGLWVASKRFLRTGICRSQRQGGMRHTDTCRIEAVGSMQFKVPSYMSQSELSKMTVCACCVLLCCVCPGSTVRFDISDATGPDWGPGSGWELGSPKLKLKGSLALRKIVMVPSK